MAKGTIFIKVYFARSGLTKNMYVIARFRVLLKFSQKRHSAYQCFGLVAEMYVKVCFRALLKFSQKRHNADKSKVLV